MEETAETLLREFEQLQSHRSQWEAHWQQIARWMLPEKASFTQQPAPGANLTRDIYDAEAPLALERFAAHMAKKCTPQAQRWFHFRLADEERMASSKVRDWLDACGQRVHQHLNSPRSKFHAKAQESYEELGAFGTACMLIEDVPGYGPRYRTVPLSECFIQENADEEVDTCHRRFELTAYQAFSAFGEDALPSSVRKAVKQEPLRKFAFLHVVKPNMAHSTKEQPATSVRFNIQQMPFLSYYVQIEEKSILVQGGFRRFPYAVSRWQKSPGEIYGRSPGMNALGETISLNELKKDMLWAFHLSIRPPLEMPSLGYIRPANIRPGALNVYDPTLGQQQRIRPLITGVQPNSGQLGLEQMRQSIQRAFYLDILEELPPPITPNGVVIRMSATEAAVRVNQNLGLFSPYIARLNAEFKTPVIELTFHSLWENDMLPAPPAELDGEELLLEYASPIDAALRAAELNPVLQWTQVVSHLREAENASVLLHPERAAEMAARVLRTPSEVLRTAEELAQLKNAQANTQSVLENTALEVEQAKALKETAQALKTLSSAREAAPLEERLKPF